MLLALTLSVAAQAQAPVDAPPLVSAQVAAEAPAFPGAEGFGAGAVGGRGGKVIFVDSLADDTPRRPQPGTFRYACEAVEGPRTIVFRTGGLITLKRGP